MFMNGYVPRESARRREELAINKDSPHALIFYEGANLKFERRSYR
jgi:16S rRNA C1402 (ribose-2'-O) methylase RsmI